MSERYQRAVDLLREIDFAAPHIGYTVPRHKVDQSVDELRVIVKEWYETLRYYAEGGTDRGLTAQRALREKS